MRQQLIALIQQVQEGHAPQPIHLRHQLRLALLPQLLPLQLKRQHALRAGQQHAALLQAGFETTQLAWWVHGGSQRGSQLSSMHTRSSRSLTAGVGPRLS